MRWRKTLLAELRRVFPPDPDDEESDGSSIAELFNVRWVPDAYRFDLTPEQLDLTFYEVEVTHPLAPLKHQQYSNLWWELDGDDLPWNLRLIAVDQWGVQREIDLMRGAYGHLIERCLNLAAPDQEKANRVTAWTGEIPSSLPLVVK